ncbi:MAG: PAS domain S-box protein [Bacteroidota bacterium]
MQTNLFQHRQEMFTAIIDSSEDAIISKNLQSIVTSWNQAAVRIFGYTESEMVGQSIQILIPADRKNEEQDIITQLKQGNRVDHFETIRITKDGRELQVSLTISPIRNSEGIIIGASKIARDITRQKQNEERLNIINEIGKSISVHLDTEAILQLVADATTKLSGAAFGAFFYNKLDANGEAYVLYACSGAPREAFEKFGMMDNAALFNPGFEGEGIVRSDDIITDPGFGEKRPHHSILGKHLQVISYLAVPVTSQNGSLIGRLFFGHPRAGRFNEEHENLVVAIAAQAAIALDNAKLYTEINILNSKKDQFIGFASHELNTPLTTIKGYLQLAKISDIPTSEVFSKIEKQVGRLEAIIGDLLDISRIQAGRMDLDYERVSLWTLIKEGIEPVNLSQHILEAELTAEDVQVVVDRQKLLQVIDNLLSNAIKYSSPHTTIHITTTVNGDQVEILIKDQGIGIPEEYLSKIFDQYYRVISEKTNVKGMGLGLFISKEIMVAHSGTIWVESVYGEGSCFHIIFPVEPGK